MSYDIKLADANSVDGEDSGDPTADFEYICAVNGAHYEESLRAAGDEIPEEGWDRFYAKSYLKNGFSRIESPLPESIGFDISVSGVGLGGGLKLDSCYPEENDINGDRLFDPSFFIEVADNRGPISFGVELFDVDLRPDSGSFDKAGDDRSASWEFDISDWPDGNEEAIGVEFDVEANEGTNSGSIMINSELGYSYKPLLSGSSRVYTEAEVSTSTSVDVI